MSVKLGFSLIANQRNHSTPFSPLFFGSWVVSRKTCTHVCQVRYLPGQQTLKPSLVKQWTYYGHLQEHGWHKQLYHQKVPPPACVMTPKSFILELPAQFSEGSDYSLPTIVCCLCDLVGRHRSSVSSLGSLSRMSLPPLSRWVWFKKEEIATQDFLAHNRVLMNKILRWHVMIKFKNCQFLLSSMALQSWKLFVVSKVQSNEILLS